MWRRVTSWSFLASLTGKCSGAYKCCGGEYESCAADCFSKMATLFVANNIMVIIVHMAVSNYL